MLPTVNRMPDISNKRKLTAIFLAASIAHKGDNLTEYEKKLLVIFIRLLDKAMYEYQIARKYLEEEVNNSARGNYDNLSIFGFWNYIEGCVITTRRIFRIFYKIKSMKGVSNIDRINRKLIEKASEEIISIRNGVEHIDEEIRNMKYLVLSINSNEDGITTGKKDIRFINLSNVLSRLHEVGILWLKEFAKE